MRYRCGVLIAVIAEDVLLDFAGNGRCIYAVGSDRLCPLLLAALLPPRLFGGSRSDLDVRFRPDSSEIGTPTWEHAWRKYYDARCMGALTPWAWKVVVCSIADSCKLRTIVSYPWQKTMHLFY